MIADFHIITITHQNLNVDELGHFVVPHAGEEDLGQKLAAIKESLSIEELIYLNTCNRVTFIIYDRNHWTHKRVERLFSSVNPELDHEKLQILPKISKVYNGEDAINHLFQVAASLDSLVVGEREIFRQFRQAFLRSKKLGFIGDNLRLLEKFTVQAAKRVYAKTKIGEKPLSIVSLAIQKLLAKNFDKSSRILMVGAGETNTKVARFLHKYNYHNVVVFNRNLDNAKTISDLLGAPAYHLSELSNFTKGFDILIICTGATSSLIDIDLYARLVGNDPSEKFIIDLSVPHNVESEVVRSFSIDFVGVEELRKLAETNLAFRKHEMGAARIILREELDAFSIIYQQRIIERAMRNVPQEIKAVKKKALESVFEKEMEALPEDARRLVHEIADYMEKKCISVPMKLAKKEIKRKV